MTGTKRLRTAAVGRGLVLVCLLAGCAQVQWQKPGATAADLALTIANCDAQLLRDFPPLLHQVRVAGGFVAAPDSGCEAAADRLDCFIDRGMYVPTDIAVVDANAERRANGVPACLTASGWARGPVR